MPLYEFEGNGPVVDPGAWIAPSAEVIGRVEIGPDCYIGWGAVIRADNAPVVLEEGAAVEEGVLIHVLPESAGGGCRVGKEATVGHGAILHNCTIEEGAVIGIRAVFCNFAVVGRWAIVGEMGLVVSGQKVGPETVAVGQPAREIGRVEQRHRDFWTAGKRLYRDYAKRNKTGLRLVGNGGRDPNPG